MISLFPALYHESCKAPLQALLCSVRLFSFAIIFFVILWLSYIVDNYVPRYDFISGALILIYGVFFVCRWRNSQDLFIHVVVHFAGLLFEVYKVDQLSWTYPDNGVMMMWGVPFYSGFMYTALVDFICQAMHKSKLCFIRPFFWKTISGVCCLIYLNFFVVHAIGIDFRYLLIAVSMILLYGVPVCITIKKTTTTTNFLALMIPFAVMVWVAENIATFSGAWLYPAQLEYWVLVPYHKIVSWYLLGQCFLFMVLVCKSVNLRLVFYSIGQTIFYPFINMGKNK